MLLLHKSQARKHEIIDKGIKNMRKGQRYGNIRSVAASHVDRRGSEGRDMKEKRGSEGEKIQGEYLGRVVGRRSPPATAVDCGRVKESTKMMGICTLGAMESTVRSELMKRTCWAELGHN